MRIVKPGSEVNRAIGKPTQLELVCVPNGGEGPVPRNPHNGPPGPGGQGGGAGGNRPGGGGNQGGGGGGYRGGNPVNNQQQQQGYRSGKLCVCVCGYTCVYSGTSYLCVCCAVPLKLLQDILFYILSK